ARDDARRADRQMLLDPIAAHMEEDEEEEAGLVAAAHAVGLARIMRLLVLVDGDGECRDLAVFRFSHLRLMAAVDEAGGKMPEQVDHEGRGELLEQLAQARSYAFEGRDRREER